MYNSVFTSDGWYQLQTSILLYVSQRRKKKFLMLFSKVSKRHLKVMDFIEVTEKLKDLVYYEYVYLYIDVYLIMFQWIMWPALDIYI